MAHACVEYAGRDLPAAIQRAISRLMDPSFPIELSAAERVAFAALLRRVEARDGQAAFWVLRANLAEMFGRVERTISNWLSGLEDKGLIEKEQRRSRWGNFACVTIHLTKLAASLLGLLDPPSPPLSSDQRKKISAGHKEGFYPIQSLQRHPPSGVDSVDKSSRVPEDCRVLLSLGIKPTGVFALMARATRLGKRLSDIVLAKETALRKARSAYALLVSLVEAKTDYKPEAVARVDASNADKHKLAIAEKKRELNDHLVRLPNGLIARCKASDAISVMGLRDDGAMEYRYTLAGPGLVKFWADAVERDMKPMPS